MDSPSLHSHHHHHHHHHDDDVVDHLFSTEGHDESAASIFGVPSSDHQQQSSLHQHLQQQQQQHQHLSPQFPDDDEDDDDDDDPDNDDEDEDDELKSFNAHHHQQSHHHHHHHHQHHHNMVPSMMQSTPTQRHFSSSPVLPLPSSSSISTGIRGSPDLVNTGTTTANQASDSNNNNHNNQTSSSSTSTTPANLHSPPPPSIDDVTSRHAMDQLVASEDDGILGTGSGHMSEHDHAIGSIHDDHHWDTLPPIPPLLSDQQGLLSSDSHHLLSSQQSPPPSMHQQQLLPSHVLNLPGMKRSRSQQESGGDSMIADKSDSSPFSKKPKLSGISEVFSNPTGTLGMAPILAASTIGIPPPPPANLKMPEATKQQSSLGGRQDNISDIHQQHQQQQRFGDSMLGIDSMGAPSPSPSPSPTSTSPIPSSSGSKKSKKGGSSSSKKKRLTWTPELHNMFVDAVNQLGINNAAPKTIHQYMNVPYLTTEHIKSHLQKYRLQMKKQGGGGNMFSGSSSGSSGGGGSGGASIGGSSGSGGSTGSTSSTSSSSSIVPKASPKEKTKKSGTSSSTTNSMPTTATVNPSLVSALDKMNMPVVGIPDQTAPYGTLTDKTPYLVGPTPTSSSMPSRPLTDPNTTNLFGLTNLLAGGAGPTSSSGTSSSTLLPTTAATTTTANVPNTGGNFSSSILPPMLQQTMMSGDDGNYEGYAHIMNYMAKEDAEISRMLEDASKQMTNADNYKFMLLGFKMGIFSGMKIGNSSTTTGIAPLGQQSDILRGGHPTGQLVAAPGQTPSVPGGSSGPPAYGMAATWPTPTSYITTGGTSSTSGTSRQTNSQDVLPPTTPITPVPTTRIQLKQTSSIGAPSQATYSLAYPQHHHYSQPHDPFGSASSGMAPGSGAPPGSGGRTKLEISQFPSNQQQQQPPPPFYGTTTGSNSARSAFNLNH